MKRIFGLTIALLSVLAINCWGMDSLNVSCVGRYFSEWRSIRDLTAFQNTQYVLMDKFLLCIDISNPSSPRTVAEHFLMEQQGQQVEIYNDNLYLLTETCLTIYDISEPNIPEPISTFNNLAGAEYLCITNDKAIISESDTTLTVLDVTDLVNPRFLSSLNLNATINNIAAKNNNIFITSPSCFYSIIIDENGELSISDSLSTQCRYIGISNTTAFVTKGANQDSIILVNISDPNDLINLGTLDGYGSFQTQLFAADSFVYVHDAFMEWNGQDFVDKGCVIIDARDPDSIRWRRNGNGIFSFKQDSLLLGIFKIYEADAREENWYQYSELGYYYRSQEDDKHIEIINDRLYRIGEDPAGSTWRYGIQYFSIQDPQKVTFEGFVVPRDFRFTQFNRWLIDTNLNLITCDTDNNRYLRIQVLDLQNLPEIQDPHVITVDGFTGLKDVKNYGPYTYIWTEAGLAVINPSEGNNVSLLNMELNPENNFGKIIHIDDMFIYLISDNQLYLIDNRDVDGLEVLSAIQSNIYDGAVLGNYLYGLTAFGYPPRYCVEIVDISDEFNPVVIDTILITEERDKYYSIKIDDERLILGSEHNFASISVYDLQDRFNPQLLGYYSNPDIEFARESPSELVLNQEYCYSVSLAYLSIYDLSDLQIVDDYKARAKIHPSAFSLSAFPNPFNSSTTIEYRVGSNSNSPVTLSLYDLSGRLVQTLVNERLMPGNYRTTLNANNLTSGMYVIRLESNTPLIKGGQGGFDRQTGSSQKVVIVK